MLVNITEEEGKKQEGSTLSAYCEKSIIKRKFSKRKLSIRKIQKEDIKAYKKNHENFDKDQSHLKSKFELSDDKFWIEKDLNEKFDKLGKLKFQKRRSQGCWLKIIKGETSEKYYKENLKKELPKDKNNLSPKFNKRDKGLKSIGNLDKFFDDQFETKLGTMMAKSPKTLHKKNGSRLNTSVRFIPQNETPIKNFSKKSLKNLSQNESNALILPKSLKRYNSSGLLVHESISSNKDELTRIGDTYPQLHYQNFKLKRFRAENDFELFRSKVGLIQTELDSIKNSSKNGNNFQNKLKENYEELKFYMKDNKNSLLSTDLLLKKITKPKEIKSKNLKEIDFSQILIKPTKQSKYFI